MDVHPSLFRVLWWGARQLAPATVAVVMLMATAYGAYRVSPGRVDLALSNLTSVDYVIVQRQLERITRASRADVALFGDSSCLMGIDPAALGRDLDLSVDGFCMLAYVGPAGYATAIERYLAQAGAPTNLIVVLHPVQFARDSSWDSWLPLVENWRPDREAAERSPRAALEMARLAWLGRVLFSPLPGAYGAYYGGERQFVADIDRSGGSAIDPGAGLLRRPAGTWRPLPSPYALEPAFMATLPRLKKAIGVLPAGTVRLLGSPVPQGTAQPGAPLLRAQALRTIATALGLESDAILDTPTTMPDHNFSSVTHLNRHGKVRFTRFLAATLRHAAQLPARERR